MDRINTATAVADLFGPGKKGFRDGNKSAGIAATDLNAVAFNGYQEELMGVIEGAGLTPNSADFTQLRQAINKMIQGGQRSVVIDSAVFAPAVTGTGEAVYWDTANSRFDLALADNTAKQRMVGFADVANSKVYAFGDAILFTGLTPGSRYYLDGTTAGAITTALQANGVLVGIARTATEMFVDIDGLGVQSNQVNTFTKGQVGNVMALPATAGTVTLDLSQSNNWEGTLAGNITLANPSTMPVGQHGVLRIVNGAVPYAVAFGAYWRFTSGVILQLTGTPGAVDLLGYYVESATRVWIGAQGDSK